MLKCCMNTSKRLLIITVSDRVSNPGIGDAYMDPKSDEFFVWDGTTWLLTDACGNPAAVEERQRNELHAKFPQLGKIWEEYSIMKKLLVGDNPGKEYGTGKT